jgi:hypothetical protein
MTSARKLAGLVIGATVAVLLTACSVWQPRGAATLPTSGAAYAHALAVAKASWPAPKLSDMNNQTDSYVCTGAIVAARTGDAALKSKVAAVLAKVRGTESGATALALGRNLRGYVCAADAIGYSDTTFRSWLGKVRDAKTTGGPPSIRNCAATRPNNWGTHCRASMVAADLYLDDVDDLRVQATMFAGWLGDYGAYHGFQYGDTSWQCDPAHPVGIDPPCTKSGVDLDGVLPDDQRRAGSFTKGAIPHENYTREAYEPALQEAVMLSQADAIEAQCLSARALLRVDQEFARMRFAATGDDTNEPWLVRWLYGQSPSSPLGATAIGKSYSDADWTHGSSSGKPC